MKDEKEIDRRIRSGPGVSKLILLKCCIKLQIISFKKINKE